MSFRVLTVKAFEEELGKTLDVTISPHLVKMLVAEDDMRQQRPLKKTQILFLDGGIGEIWVTELDLMNMQNAVGTYELPY